MAAGKGLSRLADLGMTFQNLDAIVLFDQVGGVFLVGVTFDLRALD